MTPMRSAPPALPEVTPSALIDRYLTTRARTEALAAPLSPEDQLLQGMPDASPTKWHRAHTTWFFETFVLGALGQAPRDPRRAYLWNSYYDAVGPRHPRPRRGLLSRPSAAEVEAYRREIDAAVVAALGALKPDAAEFARLVPVVELGLAHEEQHQELLLTDILNAFAASPLAPAYREAPAGVGEAAPGAAEAARFVPFAGGLVEIGAAPGRGGFAFDNEGPRHRVWLEPFALASRLVTVGEVAAFIAAGGYRTPSLWLSAGWDFVRAEGIEAPLYARVEDGVYRVFGLHGERVADAAEPASHLSYYEADAVARFLGGRLPSEAEWEWAVTATGADPAAGHQLDAASALHPRPWAGGGGEALGQAFGDVWEWTQSAYAAYPGFVAGPGAIGEYNGKFMVNQQVLRGGSCLSPRGHLRASYRNFWPANTRFQMTGLRIARDLGAP